MVYHAELIKSRYAFITNLQLGFSPANRHDYAMSKSPIIVWFRQDLRLNDNAALYHATQQAQETGAPILPIYILDDENAGQWALGGAARVWLHHSLHDLSTNLDNALQIFHGKADDIIPELIHKTRAQEIYWNRCYEPWRITRDKAIKLTLENQKINVKSFNSSLLWEPWDVLKDDGTPYKVFSPFYKKGCLIRSTPPRDPYPTPQNINFYTTCINDGKTIVDLSLLPNKPRWDIDMAAHWDISEQGALNRLNAFLDKGLNNYKDGRNEPALDNVSRLSPYLRHGNISPHTVWHAAAQAGTAQNIERDRDHFLSELGWREFSYYLLYHFPDLTWKNLQPKFDNFPWETDDTNSDVENWQKGLTGYPIVDAGMRELYATGSMHNRVRMIVGSFLVKNMLTHWHIGEKWFWDTLVDADLASNSASWQWIAGCGADAAPYFRIFNPLLQSQKFDKDGDYIKKYVPELSKMPAKHIHAPWEAPNNVLEYAGVTLGKTYPKPMMGHSDARDRALQAFEKTKGCPS